MAITIGGGISIGGGITIEVPSTPVITINSQPSSASVTSGSSATFSVTASVTQSASLSYQWQKAESFAPSTWGNVLGATSSSYTTSPLTVASDNGDKYRVIVSATGGATDVTSNTATVTVSAAVITILSQPSSTSASEGGTASFNVSAVISGGATLSYQWALQAGGSGLYSNIGGATSSSYTTGTLTSGDNNNNYRVVVSGTKEASPVTSNPAALTVSGGGSGTTYTEGVDYSQSGGGFEFSGSSSAPTLSLSSFGWSNAAGFTAMTSLTSGTSFTVTMPSTGSTPYTLTLTSSWAGPPSLKDATATASPSLPSFNPPPNGTPTSVTIGGGGGGGSSSTGTITVGSNSGYYGAGGPTGGTLSISPAVAQVLMFIGMATSTVVAFADGTYGGVVVDASGIDGATNVSVTLNSITQSGTVSRQGTQWVLTLSGDPFFLQTLVGQTKSVEISWS